MDKIDLVCTTSVSRRESLIARTETNDCVVRAFSAAFEVSYDKSHAFCAETLNRKPGRGTVGSSRYLSTVDSVLGKKVVGVGEPIWPNSTELGLYTYYPAPKSDRAKEPVRRSMTVKTFLKQYSKGTYLVYVPGHAFAIKDGVVYGNVEDAKRMRTRIWRAFQVK